MTLKELSQRLGRSEATLASHFERTKTNLAKKGIYIEKYGSGKTAEYTLQYGYELEEIKGE